MCTILGCAAQVCLLAAVLCGSAATVCPYPMSTAGGLLLWVLWRGEKPKNELMRISVCGQVTRVTSCNKVVIEGTYLNVCSLSFVSVVISVSSPLCARAYLSSIQGVCAFYFISVLFGGSVTWSQTCLVIVAWHYGKIPLKIKAGQKDKNVQEGTTFNTNPQPPRSL